MFQRQGSQEQRRRQMWKNLVKLRDAYREDGLAKKWDQACRIRFLQEDGKIAIVTSGMDCDCVKYSGVVTVVPATLVHVRREVESQYEWADGPMSCYTQRPSYAKGIKYESRDLAMEARENGHPHVVYA